MAVAGRWLSPTTGHATLFVTIRSRREDIPNVEKMKAGGFAGGRLRIYSIIVL